MIINHNISALNTYRNLTNVNNALQKSLERLSSGLRINRAADDAAGLAISEKMRGQIRGLSQAIRNAQDAISLIQTAEGALNESEAILQRMRELAAQAASDTNTPDERLKIQQEIDALAKELSRITNTTEFNTKNLLAGGLQTQKFHIGANQGQNVDLSIDAMDAFSLGVTAKQGAYVIEGGGVTITTTADIGALQTGVYSVDVQYYGATGTGTVADFAIRTNTRLENWKVVISTTSTATLSVTIDEGSTTITVIACTDAYGWDDVAQEIEEADVNDWFTVVTASTASAAAGTIAIEGGWAALKNEAGSTLASVATTATTYSFDFNTDGDTATDLGIAVTSPAKAGDIRIQVVNKESSAAVVTADGQVVNDAHVEKGLLVVTHELADQALVALDQAIEKVSNQRSRLGALQNRLEHTINNLSVARENLTAAESRIRDLDMAEEMMAYTKNQIISQAATAMLAQANQVPAIVLQLLR